MPPPAERPTFYHRVYEMVRQVPRGSIVTYGQVAVLLGSPAAARAVGYALYFLEDQRVPWWRVVNARGGISLRGRGASADLQRHLLEREGVCFNQSGRLDIGAYRWWPGDEPGPQSGGRSPRSSAR